MAMPKSGTPRLEALASRDQQFGSELLAAGKALLVAAASTARLGEAADLRKLANAAVNLQVGEKSVLHTRHRSRVGRRTWPELGEGLSEVPDACRLLEALAYGYSAGVRGKRPELGTRLFEALAALHGALCEIDEDIRTSTEVL